MADNGAFSLHKQPMLLVVPVLSAAPNQGQQISGFRLQDETGIISAITSVASMIHAASSVIELVSKSGKKVTAAIVLKKLGSLRAGALRTIHLQTNPVHSPAVFFKALPARLTLPIITSTLNWNAAYKRLIHPNTAGSPGRKALLRTVFEITAATYALTEDGAFDSAGLQAVWAQWEQRGIAKPLCTIWASKFGGTFTDMEYHACDEDVNTICDILTHPDGPPSWRGIAAMDDTDMPKPANYIDVIDVDDDDDDEEEDDQNEEVTEDEDEDMEDDGGLDGQSEDEWDGEITDDESQDGEDDEDEEDGEEAPLWWALVGAERIKRE